MLPAASRDVINIQHFAATLVTGSKFVEVRYFPVAAAQHDA
jgi:hypothetical protein